MSTEMIIMMIGLGLGSHFHKALTDFCESFSKKKKEEEQKNKEAELAELGILPKSGIS